MRLSSCISLDLLYIHNGDEPSEKKMSLNIVHVMHVLSRLRTGVQIV